MSSYKLEMDNLQSILRKRGLEEGGKVQEFVNVEAMSRCDKYVPLDKGNLKNTVQMVNQHRAFRYPVPYARRQYYSTPQSRPYDNLRGAMWFERMKNREGVEILKGAATLAGGKPAT